METKIENPTKLPDLRIQRKINNPKLKNQIEAPN
jgi:hypothetical protein